MSNPANYAPITGTVQTSQPGLQDSESYPFARALPQEPEQPMWCCRAWNYLAMVCTCVVHYCGAVCECDGDDECDD